MGSAQLDLVGTEETTKAVDETRPSALRQQVAERLAAHRQRRERLGAAASAASPDAEANARSPRHRVAAAVAERYANTPSYRAFLADQARRAVEEAAAAAEVAMRNAEAVAAAQRELLLELELWNAPQNFTPKTARTIEQPRAGGEQSPPVAEPRAGITVRLYEDLRTAPSKPHAAAPEAAGRSPRSRPDSARPWELNAEEAMALDAEIAFRHAPVFEEFWCDLEPPVPLPANLLEFPRQLVAVRKARPRLAEGPLREEVTPRTAQLRIFEVEPEQISTAPTPVPAGPEWTSIRLDAQSVVQPDPNPQASPDAPPMPLPASLLAPQTAPLGLRIMAALVDGIAVAGAALAVSAVFARIAGQVPGGLPALLGVAGILIVLHTMYHLLFFTFSDQTPGMRYARIGLCTFSDENPTRAAMRKRILAQFVAVCPLGIGLLWIWLDDDGLGWHDRISRMYQRAY